RWRGLALHYGRRKTPVLTLVVDETYPHLFSIRYPDGWTSTPANVTRAKDAAYGHARWLLSRKPDLKLVVNNPPADTRQESAA
ncbi:hypothetical protein, partial [Methyloceanibacter sp.]|uniref:hypothetical protein n=1 Tax=Methyloceanibacter sp. TaxID=1965321 RepID=UPI00351AEAF7